MNTKRLVLSLLLCVAVSLGLTACSSNVSSGSASGSQSAAPPQSADKPSSVPQSTGEHIFALSKQISWQGFTFQVDDQNWKIPKDFGDTPKAATIYHDINIDSGPYGDKVKNHICLLRLYSATHGQTESLLDAWTPFKSSISDDREPKQIDSWTDDGIVYTTGIVEPESDGGANNWLFTCYDPVTKHGIALNVLLWNGHWSYDDQLELFNNLVSTSKYVDPSATTYDAFDSWTEYYRQVNGESSSSAASSPTSESKSSGSSSHAAIPTEYKSALKKAQSYNDMMHMSKAGLYEQLTSEYGEKFTTEAAQYAVDNVKADWKANALKTAKRYQSTMDMSPAAIYDQLVSDYGEKFTPEEAQFAIDHL